MGDDPRADRGSVLAHGRARFTVLTDRMVRMEWAQDGCFEDRATLAVVNRRLPKVRFDAQSRGAALRLRTDCLDLRYEEKGQGFAAGNLWCRFRTGGVRGEWRFGQKDKGNLGGTWRTLDGYRGQCKEEWKRGADGKWARTGTWVSHDLPPGLISRSGWSVFDDGGGVVLDPEAGGGRPWVTARPEGRRQDVYFMAYGHDYRRWIRDASLVFGRQPLPPRFAFGYWYSKYWAYTDREIERLVRSFDLMDVPIDVLVIDMDWHKPGWTGYTWDRGYFPDPKETLRWLKSQGLKVTLNLHPAQGVGDNEEAFGRMFEALGRDPQRLNREPLKLNDVLINRRRIRMDMTDPRYVEAYFRFLHRPLERMGVDFWWMDWQQGTETKIKGLDPLPWINHLHWMDMAGNAARAGRRPICFSRYGGVGAGRYPVGFSGDTFVHWDSLAFQPRFTATAANVLYGYWSHDIGGHMHGTPSPELFTRWVQFGVFSPILRTHCTKAIEAERRVWLYPEPYRDVMAEWIRRRYGMVPYIYSESRRCFDTGLSLLRPLYYHHPGDAQAYEFRDQYYFGEAMLVSPVVGPADPRTGMATVRVWLPCGEWFDTAAGRRLRGGRVHVLEYTIEEVPVFVRAGAVIPGQTPPRRLTSGGYPNLVVTCYPGGDGEYDLYEDDGVSQDYLRGRHATVPLTHRHARGKRRVTVGPARGAFEGFRARRPVEVRLAGMAPPRSVSVDGRTLRWRFRPCGEGWTYDGDSATVVIRVRSANLRRAVRIEAVEDPAVPTGRLDGMKGLMTRLTTVMNLAKLVSPCWPMLDDERLAAEAAQTGNRVSRDPSSCAAELRRLRRALGRLPDMLREFEGLYRARNDGKAAEVLAQARGILAATSRAGFRCCR